MEGAAGFDDWSWNWQGAETYRTQPNMTEFYLILLIFTCFFFQKHTILYTYILYYMLILSYLYTI